MGQYEEEAKAREKEAIAENDRQKAVMRKYDLAMTAARRAFRASKDKAEFDRVSDAAWAEYQATIDKK